MPRLLQYHKYGPHLTTHDALKALAILAMVVDHVGKFFFPEEELFRVIGRTAFPMFFFLIGYARSTRISGELVFWAGLMVTADIWQFYPVFSTNILVTVITVRLFFRLYERFGWAEVPLWQLYLVLMIWWFPAKVLFEYGTVAMLWALCGHLVREGRRDGAALLFMALTQVTYIALEQAAFAFSLPLLGIFMVLMTVMGALLYRYQLKTLDNLGQGRWQAAVKFISRYSLALYAIHYLIFQTVAWVLHPEAHQEFQWLDL